MSDFNSIFDASVVGGGIVGKTAALALARTGLRVALLARAPAPLPANAAACDGRVYAVSGGTQRLLERLRVWQALDRARLSPVYDMRVYGDAHAELHFPLFRPRSRNWRGLWSLHCLKARWIRRSVSTHQWKF